VKASNPELSSREPTSVAYWDTITRPQAYDAPALRRRSKKSLAIAGALFFLTLCTTLLAGTYFAIAYSHNQAASFDEVFRLLPIFYHQPTMLLRGLPFALTLLTILLAHELGHMFACRYHRIRATYPFFIPAPTLIGTFGAFIVIRSPIRTTRALFDVGASGPLVGFAFAIPALLFGVLHAKFVPGLADNPAADLRFGVPAILHLFAAAVHPGVPPAHLLLHPVGRAAWVGILATALNLLPVGQLDGGHILRSISPRGHRIVSLILPLALVPLGILYWSGWYVWAALLLGLRFFRSAPIYDFTPVDPRRRFCAALALLVLLLCFMPYPIQLLR
jgi:membrane-associated protease RseP (regulator of RpoE activity)